MNTTDSALELDETQGCTVLRSVHGQGRIDGVLLTMTLRQAYRNDSRVDIEAVYTFPLAWAATLLELGVEIGGKRLAGQIVEKAQAEGVTLLATPRPTFEVVGRLWALGLRAPG